MYYIISVIKGPPSNFEVFDCKLKKNVMAHKEFSMKSLIKVHISTLACAL